MTPKIVDYRLVAGHDRHSLGLSVSEMIAEGWQPFGPPVAFNPHPDNEEGYIDAWAQAMVRYADSSAPERPARTPIETKNSPAVGS